MTLLDAAVISGRFAQCDEHCTADCGHCKGRRHGPYRDRFVVVDTSDDFIYPDGVNGETFTAENVQAFADTLNRRRGDGNRDHVAYRLVRIS